MWIEVTSYPRKTKCLVHIDQIVLIEQFSKDYSVITLSLEDENFIQVKETYEEIKTMLLELKKEKENEQI